MFWPYMAILREVSKEHNNGRWLIIVNCPTVGLNTVQSIQCTNLENTKLEMLQSPVTAEQSWSQMQHTRGTNKSYHLTSSTTRMGQKVLPPLSHFFRVRKTA